MERLRGKVAIVTGGATGIGRAAALALVTEGASVVVGDVDDRGGSDTVEQLVSSGGRGHFVHTDVGATQDVEDLVRGTVERYGKLDVLFNNVGVAIPGSVTELTEDDWNRVLNVNLTSVWRGMRYAIPEMIRAGGGSIINTSSVQSVVGFTGWAGYAASKGGINSLTTQAAVDYAPHNVRINALLPGTILTPMNERIIQEAEDGDRMRQWWESMHPMGRLGRPEEVAAAVVFLASDESSFLTGECLRVDGGMVVKAG